MSRDKPSVRVIRQQFRVHGHPIGLEKAEEIKRVLERVGSVTGMSERDVLDVLAVNANDGSLDRLDVMLGVGDEG